jgi:uracil-DNA glycosylase family 4
VLARCRACPRLAAHLDGVRESHPGYHAAPVPAWGVTRARLLIVGLAPGMHGANRTGQPFTGDASGTFLFAAMARQGLVSDPDPSQARLNGVRITNAVKCLPPENRPNAAEVRCCSHFLRQELADLWSPATRKPRCILALGRLAHQAVGIATGKRLADFRHGQVAALDNNLWLANTYHPSRQNTNTGRLTAPMLDDVLRLVVGLVEPGSR